MKKAIVLVIVALVWSCQSAERAGLEGPAGTMTSATPATSVTPSPEAPEEAEKAAASQAAAGSGASAKPAGAGSDPAAASTGALALPRRFTLAEVDARILDNANLRLAAFAFREAEARGRVDQAALWPNPYVLVRKRRVDDLDVAGTGFLEVEAGQPFELGGKRGARIRLAEAEAAVVTEEVRALTLMTLRDAEQQYYRVLRLAEDRAQIEEEARAAGDLAQLARARFESGKASRVAWLRLQATTSNTRLMAQDLARREEAACRALDDLLGTAAGTVQGVEGAFDRAVLTALDRRAADQALSHHPRRLVREKAVTAADRALASTKANAWPDLTAALAFERDEDVEENFFGFMFNLPLPLWDRNQGERATARAALHRARKDLEAETLTLQVALGEAWIAYEKADRNVEGYTREVIPPLEASLGLTRQAFEAGKVAYLDVLDALVALIRSRRARLDHLEARALAAVEIRYLTAAGLEE